MNAVSGSALRSLRIAACLLIFAPPLANAQQPIAPAPADPAIAGALTQVSADRIRATIEKLVTFNNRSTLSSMETDLKPGTGVTAAADWIESEFKRISAACGNCLVVRRDEFIEPPQTGPAARIVKPTKLINVYAILRGTDPAQAPRMVLVTGHYDSRNSDNFNTHDPAPGANDDASGVAVSLECARVLSKLKFPSSIVFVAVAGEEQGLNGSLHLARLAKAQGWQLEAVLNNDIVGGDTTPGDTTQDKTAIRIFSEGVPAAATPEQAHALINLGAENDSPSRELARTVADVSSTYFPPVIQRAAQGTPANRPHSNLVRTATAFHPVLIFRRDRYLRGGDHTSFNAEGFTAVRFTEWRENFDHQHQNVRLENGTQYGDLIQYVDFNYVANVARLNAATLATLAFAPGVPQNVHIETTALDNNTVLSWTPPAGMPAGATYEVVWRPTDQPTWTMAQSAGATTSIKLPISKDNVIFGVRSVDAAGHRSIPVFPTPTRPSRSFVPAAPPQTPPHP
ncbi:M28 family metallopeptidase [Edaphobacter aggregans]|uniref:M28 family metallopeptidase n=1 Tax=Edaphobacter aggregans TaxID=570835 RepID=UPI000554D0D5|nr:M28 family metallopeptidase [Edaphobacter aggregans]